MTEEFKDFRFPAYSEIVRNNKRFENEYRGYEIFIHVNDGLYLSIECQNESAIYKNADDAIRFAWCNKAGFAVAQVRYKNCEAGYLLGCAYLLHAADEMKNIFGKFINKNCHSVSQSLIQYQEQHPEEDVI